MSDIAAASRRRRRTQATLRVVLGIACPVFLLALWELAATQGLVDRRFFPPPTKILASAWSLLSATDSRAQLLADTATTLRRLGIGYGIGSVAGIGMGMAMGLYGPLRHAFSPIVYGTFPTPKIAIYPLLIAMFGIGEGSKFALVILGVFYMTCINTLSGVLYSNPIHRDVIKAFHIPPVVGWFRVVLPSAMPAIVTGLKLGLGQALILVVSAEFVSAEDGIGHYIWDSWQVLAIPRMFVGLAMVTVIGGAAVLLGGMAERRLVPWGNH